MNMAHLVKALITRSSLRFRISDALACLARGSGGVPWDLVQGPRPSVILTNNRSAFSDCAS